MNGPDGASRTNSTGFELKPVDRAKEVTLPNRDATMAQDVVCSRDKEVEIWQGELLQIVVALHLPLVTAGSPGEVLSSAPSTCARVSVLTKPRAVSMRCFAAAKLVSSQAGWAG